MGEKVVFCVKPDEHGANHVKPVESMAICPKGIKYCMELVESGEMEPKSCELCVKEWLCGEPIETCMNPEDDIQWWTQCTRSVGFWVIHMEVVLNSREWMGFIGDHFYYNEAITSIMKCIDKYEISVQLVAPGI